MVNELDHILRESVERQLLSDVPLGFFLSGGLDSSLLVGITRDLHPNTKFDCFTIASNMDNSGEGFEDDLPYARNVASYLDVDLHVLPADHKISEQFDHMIWHLDEPQADPAPINVYNISKGAREQGIKVLLGGTAGDDLFSGYRRHQALKYDQYVEAMPVTLRKVLKKGIHKLSGNKPWLRRLQKLSRDWDKPMEKRMLGYFNWLPDDEYVFSLFENEILNGARPSSVYSFFDKILREQSPNLSSLDRLLYLEMKTFLVDHNLNYTDKMSMAAGVEARVPYLDKELVSFAGKIPTKYKLRGNETKYILKKVAEKYLPHDVIYRSKTGFGAPIRDWLKNDLKPFVNQRLNKEHLKKQGIFDPNAVQEMISKNDSGEFDFSYTIWSMLAIQSWLKQFKWSL
ncbi:MAG: asparagine synthase C-terminal domain-containing protein [Balneolaceae bacterium]|nr:asparagine synthase C-terminal domain-containing protein [Balneolaceae bacterium]